jgi:hypothetical protein
MPVASQPRSATYGVDAPPAEIAILWLTAGLSCDGDTIAMTAAAQPRGFDRDAASIQSVRPGMATLGVSSKTGVGMNEHLDVLESGLLSARGVAVAGRAS